MTALNAASAATRPPVAPLIAAPVQTLADLELSHLDPQARRALAPMLELGVIGRAELIAADRWTKLHALAVHGAKIGPGGSAARDPGGVGDAKLIAVTQYRHADDAIGSMGTRLLAAVLADGRSMKSLADDIGVSHSAYVTGMVVAVLKRLAQHFADRASRH